MNFSKDKLWCVVTVEGDRDRYYTGSIEEETEDFIFFTDTKGKSFAFNKKFIKVIREWVQKMEG